MLDFSLYVILDEKYLPASPELQRGEISPEPKAHPERFRDISAIVSQICKGGATMMQLREKGKDTKKFLLDALEVRKVTKEFGIPFIVNDRVDIALAVNADGVHLGEEDISLPYAKKIIGNKVIGISVDGVSQAVDAARGGAAYVTVGCLFPSRTTVKPFAPLSLITKIKDAVSIPVLGIGGITIDKIGDVLKAGADGICVAGDIFSYPNLKERTQKFRAEINHDKAWCKHRPYCYH